MDQWQPLLESLTTLRDSWPLPPWTWDSRFGAVAASFTKDLEATARASAQHAFPRGWTVKSIDTAPSELRAIADRTGGLRSNQRLLGGDETTCPALFGLWWPWAGGERTTLRIGLAGIDLAAPPYVLLSDLFGVKR